MVLFFFLNTHLKSRLQLVGQKVGLLWLLYEPPLQEVGDLQAIVHQVATKIRFQIRPGRSFQRLRPETPLWDGFLHKRCGYLPSVAGQGGSNAIMGPLHQVYGPGSGGDTTVESRAAGKQQKTQCGHGEAHPLSVCTQERAWTKRRMKGNSKEYFVLMGRV